MSLLQPPVPPGHPAPTITVNGQPWSWHATLTVASLLEDQGFHANAVATALNGHFVARQARDATMLKPGDQLTVFQAIVGG